MNNELLIRLLPAAISTFLSSNAILAASEEGSRELRAIVITLVDDKGRNANTFQSHNQKVVANANGIFMTYLRENNDDEKGQPNVWRLVQSKDGGSSFSVVFEGHDRTAAPVIETDGEGNIYLAHPDYDKREFYFYRFGSDDDYRVPEISVFPNAPCAAKYAMAYDLGRKRFYIATQYGRLLTVGPDGKLLSNTAVLKQIGPKACTQYPLLFIDESGTLHHAWTTAARTGYHYPSIHYLKSPDGGVTWRRMNGAIVETPVVPDWTGPSDVICLEDEFDVLTWLAGFWIKGGKAHFAYRARAPLDRQHYMRFDLKTGKRERDESHWRGARLVIASLSALFASESQNADSPLYVVQASADGRLACLVSRDNGDTWHDFAVSEKGYSSIYAVGGCRTVTPDGYVIGSFSALGDSDNPVPATARKIYFFKIQVKGRKDS